MGKRGIKGAKGMHETKGANRSKKTEGTKVAHCCAIFLGHLGIEI